MIKDYLSIIGTQIHQHDDGNILAVASDVIIDTDTGKIEGLWVKSLTLPLTNAVLRTSDIIEWKSKIYIKDDSVISESDDLINITEILEKEIMIVGNNVENKEGRYLGSVYDFDFDTKNLKLRQIYTEKKFIGLFGYQRRIFSFNSIIKIKKSAIIVEDKTEIKEEIIEPVILESPAVT
ncbi:PRC-barrel domain-containing protein [Candidatus Peregrinibacteria bacterium]|nr:PRC-barrel domain-containing protein [Candidatus Peregrinibacteria bacterium]